MNVKVYLIGTPDPKLKKKLSGLEIETFKPKGSDWETFISVLQLCPKNKFCFFLQSSSITKASNNQILQFLKDSLTQEWDLLYLCKWLDRCDLYPQYQKSNSNYFTVRSYFPNGLQALIVSPQGRVKILSDRINGEIGLTHSIRDGKLIALSSIPNIFEINPETNNETVKYYPCQTVYPTVIPDLSEETIVNNLMTQINELHHPPIVKEDKKDKTVYEKFNSYDINFFIKIFYLVIIVSVLIDIGIKLYREKKEKVDEH